MKKSGVILVIFLILAILSGKVFAESSWPNGDFQICTNDDLFRFESANTISYLTVEVARSGCCSWHGGVCDCVRGRVVCCDGTFSPSCTCHSDTIKQ